MERKLASIQTITNLEPIEGADLIEKAVVLGWSIVVKKGLYEVGSKAVFFEIDSLIPRQPWSEFLVDQNKPDKPIRVKSRRLRGTLSQGLLIPINEIPELVVLGELGEGLDVTELLKVEKYELPSWDKSPSEAKGRFPSFIPKTDEPRVQSFYDEIKKGALGEKVYAAAKLDGMSISCYLFNDEFGVCSRNLELKNIEGNNFWEIVKKLEIEKKLRDAGLDGIALQGEFVGEGIQANRLKLKGRDIYFFNAFDIKEGKYLDKDDFVNLIESLDLKTVPIVDEFVFTEDWTIEKFVDYAVKKSVINPDVWEEGFVFRTLNEKNVHGVGRVSWKAINNEFLLKHGE